MNKLVLLAGLLIACGGPAIPPVAPSAPPPAAAAPATRPSAGESRPARASLYARLGGKPAITAVTGELLDRVAADARIRYRFLNTDLGKLKASLIDFVCMATGGPCKYTGQDMETSHAGMELVDDEFTALVEDLAGALDRFKVPAREKAELLGALAPLQPAIVTPPGRLKPVDDAAIARATAVAVKLADENAIELMQAAIVAARRGQRNYADLLFQPRRGDRRRGGGRGGGPDVSRRRSAAARDPGAPDAQGHTARLEPRLQRFGEDRLFLVPDCGFATFCDNPISTPEVAERKLSVLAGARRSLLGHDRKTS